MNTETKVQTDGPVSFQAIMTWVTFAVMIVCMAVSFSGSSVRSELPEDKTLEQYLADFQPNFKKALSEEQWNRVVTTQKKLGERILELEKKHVEKGFVELEALGSYMPKSRHVNLEKVFEEDGLKIENASIFPINGIDGKQLADERTGELCYALEPVKIRFEKANKAYHERTGGEFKVNSCWRGPNRQIANKTIAVYSCLLKESLKDKLAEKKDFDAKLATVDNASDDEIWACWRDTGSTERIPIIDGKKASPVGGILTSRHSSAEGLDIMNWYTEKAGIKFIKPELKAEGFKCGLSSGWGGKVDKNHCWPEAD